MFDIAIAQDNDTGVVTVHHANCPVVRKMADEGHPVMTMFGCEKMPDVVEYKRHSCLDQTSPPGQGGTTGKPS